MAAAKKSTRKKTASKKKSSSAKKTSRKKVSSAKPAVAKTAKKAKQLGVALEVIGGVIETGAAMLNEALSKKPSRKPAETKSAR